MMDILIVDDEKPAREELAYILSELLAEATLHQAVNGQEALKALAKRPVDVVFLDINMPGLDGLQTAAVIMEAPDPPLVVFATAYNDHALKAFELAAFDYVVKPFDERRLAQTVGRIEQTLGEKQQLDGQLAAIKGYLQAAVPQNSFSKLWGERPNGNRALIDYGDVVYLEAVDKKVYAHTAVGEQLLVRYTLKELEDRLAGHDILRVHKAFLVNLNFIGEVVPWFSGNFQIKLATPAAEGIEIPLSRRYAAQLKKLTDWR